MSRSLWRPYSSRGVMVHTVYTLRYARFSYSGSDGGVSFNQDEPACYADFAYPAFTLGMTFQVSDTDISDTAIRRTALKQALLSYALQGSADESA